MQSRRPAVVLALIVENTRTDPVHFHGVANDVFAGEVDEDQSERFTRTQHLSQDTKEAFRTLCLETRVYHVNNSLTASATCSLW